MRGLSLTPPWPFAILRLEKRIENRERWSGCDYRGPIALHASGLPTGVNTWWARAKHEASYEPRRSQRGPLDAFIALTDQCLTLAERNGVDVESLRPVTLRKLCCMTGNIVGTADIVGVVRRDGVVVIGKGATRAERALTVVESSWWFGGFALVLDNVKPVLPFVACKGALGLWELPVEVAERLAMQGNV